MPTLDTARLIGLGLIIAAFVFLVIDRQALKTDIATQETQITKLSDANASFAEAAARTNAQIKDLADKKASMEALYQQAVIEANKRDYDNQKKITEITNDKVTGDHCLYVHALFTKFMKGRHL